MKEYGIKLFYIVIDFLKGFFTHLFDWITSQSLVWLILIPNFFTILFIIIKLFYVPGIRWGMALLPTIITMAITSIVVFAIILDGD